MVGIKEELAAELKDALKKGDTRRRDAIRQIETEVAMARTAPDDVDDELYRRVISGYVKKMAKAAREYRQLGDRGREMAEKLEFEVDYLSRWLPTKLDEEETRRLVAETIARLGAAGDPKAAGRVIGAIMQEHKEEVDGGLVARLVSEELGGG